MDSKIYLLASFACLGTVLFGIAVLLGVMYWQPPYWGWSPKVALPVGFVGFALTLFASFKMGAH